ncbi:MAG: preprotein translocase subunit SecG, partial [Patescibacteria group bacterium]
MQKIIDIIQIVIALLLIGAILLQNKSGGLSEVFGGSGANIYKTRRGAEKFIFWATVIL